LLLLVERYLTSKDQVSLLSHGEVGDHCHVEFADLIEVQGLGLVQDDVLVLPEVAKELTLEAQVEVALDRV
jgi:hypothetical protein